MGFIEIFLIGVGLSADAFSVAVCKGLNMRKLNLKQGYVIAFFFGIFQAAMPIIGYFLGTSFSKYIESFDHWVAFGLLLFIGGKMVIEAIREKDEEEKKEELEKLNIGELTLMAIATSIDALAVGITFAFLDTNIFYAALIIGVTTFALSLAGVIIGNKFGAKYKNKAEIAGGIILILIGAKILLEHLGIINF